jgi:hypothetical protein
MKKPKADQWMNFELVWWMTERVSWMFWPTICTESKDRQLTDGEQCPRDSCGASCITLARSKGVRAAGRRKEEQAEEDKDLGPEAGMVRVCVHAECLKGREDNKNDGP